MESVTLAELRELKFMRKMLKGMEYILWLRKRIAKIDILESNIGRLKSYLESREKELLNQQLDYVRETHDKKANPYLEVKRKGYWVYDEEKMLAKLQEKGKKDCIRTKTIIEIDKNALKEALKHVEYDEQMELGATWVDDYQVSLRPIGDLPPE